MGSLMRPGLLPLDTQRTDNLTEALNPPELGFHSKYQVHNLKLLTASVPVTVVSSNNSKSV